MSILLLLLSIYFIYMGLVIDPKLEKESNQAIKKSQDSIATVHKNLRSIRYRLAAQLINGVLYDAVKLNNCYNLKVYINDTLISSIYLDTFKINKHLDFKIPVIYGFGREMIGSRFFKNKEYPFDSSSSFHNDLKICMASDMRIYKGGR